MGQFLYHSTYSKNISSIMKNGLIPGSSARKNWDGMYTNGFVFLAFDPDNAESYAETAPNATEHDIENIITLRIDASRLNLKKIRYDWNVHCDSPDEISTVAYSDVIPPDAIVLYKNAGSRKSEEAVKDIFNKLVDIWEDKIGCENKERK